MADKKPGAPEPAADDGKKEIEVAAKQDAEQSSAAASKPNTAADMPDQLDDQTTAKAIDDIVAGESDTVLAAEDAANAKTTKSRIVVSKSDWQDKLRRLTRSRWTWAAVAVVIIIFAVPVTRYKILGLVVKKPVTVTVRDSRSNTPVSSAEVSLGGAMTKTDANGQARLRAAVGSHSLQITKQYYQTSSSRYFVGFKAATPPPVKLVATGRLVPLTVINTITGKPLKGVEVQVLGTTAKTDAQGHATVALPATKDKDAAKLVLSGYNTTAVSIEVTNSVVKANTFNLTPAGHIYFLSNLNGTIDVVRSDLDGANRKTVLAGTGKEDQNTTSLLASRDWRYLVLKARRDTTLPALYLIDTSDDKVTQFDSGDANFDLVGWYGHAFIYDLARNAVSNWQSGQQILKSYDADHLQLNQLDENQADGDMYNYAKQGFSNFYILNGVLVYNTQWNFYGVVVGSDEANGKTDTIRAIQLSNQSKKDYQSFPTTTTGYVQAALYEPQSVYYAVYSNTSNAVNYYDFENQAVKTASIDDTSFNKDYPTFLLSPSGNQTFWTELRDGQNALFIGDANAQGKKQLASFSDYSPYGWYSDSYVLLSKNSSELYIMPASGLSGNRQPLKVTDYYKPAQTYRGYGYGYGGL